MSNKKIFIVDDDELLSTMLQDFLTTKNLGEISLFTTGEKCLEALKNEKPDVVVLDYHLNSIAPNAANGIKILETIHKAYPSVFVIVLSSQDSYGVASQTIAKGAIQYVVKGEDSFQELAEIIEGL
jgi:DNA-binding NarL/FixJ family response regulator